MTLAAVRVLTHQFHTSRYLISSTQCATLVTCSGRDVPGVIFVIGYTYTPSALLSTDKTNLNLRFALPFEFADE